MAALLWRRSLLRAASFFQTYRPRHIQQPDWMENEVNGDEGRRGRVACALNEPAATPASWSIPGRGESADIQY